MYGLAVRDVQLVARRCTLAPGCHQLHVTNCQPIHALNFTNTRHDQSRPIRKPPQQPSEPEVQAVLSKIDAPSLDALIDNDPSSDPPEAAAEPA